MYVYIYIYIYTYIYIYIARLAGQFQVPSQARGRAPQPFFLLR